MSAAISADKKLKLLALVLTLELYTLGASTVGMLTSNSVVFIANFVIAATGALGSGLSLYTMRRMLRGTDLRNTYGFGRLETISSLVVGITMVLAILFIGYEVVENLRHPKPAEGGLVAMILTAVSMFVSTWLWIRNYRLSQTEASPVFDAIWRMCRMGALEDLLIVGSVSLALIFREATWAHYVDTAASVILLITLLHSVFEIFRGSIGDLLDRSIDEMDQLTVMRELAHHFDEYDQIHGIRTRRSGSHVFIDLLLEFAPDCPATDIYDLGKRLSERIGAGVEGAVVSIVPTAPH